MQNSLKDYVYREVYGKLMVHFDGDILVLLNMSSTDLLIDRHELCEPYFRAIQMSLESQTFRAIIPENIYL